MEWAVRETTIYYDRKMHNDPKQYYLYGLVVLGYTTVSHTYMTERNLYFLSEALNVYKLEMVVKRSYFLSIYNALCYWRGSSLMLSRVRRWLLLLRSIYEKIRILCRKDKLFHAATGMLSLYKQSPHTRRTESWLWLSFHYVVYVEHSSRHSAAFAQYSSTDIVVIGVLLVLTLVNYFTTESTAYALYASNGVELRLVSALKGRLWNCFAKKLGNPKMKWMLM